MLAETLVLGKRWQRVLLKGVLIVGLALTVWGPRTALAGEIIHVVQPGENLFRIGLRYGVGWQTIMAANGLYSTNIYAGQTLVIPGTTAEATPAPPAPTPPPAPAPPPEPGTDLYVIQRGDTLWLIAQRFGVTVDDLMRLNALANPNLIFAGQTLVVGGAGATPSKLLSVAGREQALPLDCESRSAVDWAGYFGFAIDELAFFGRLPVSDDPDAGFVGNVYGWWGQTPPAPYGVHAEPVAAVLRSYGVPARARAGMTWEALRAEIEAGRPVMVWVVGAVQNGTAAEYTAASTGRTTVVAAYEHTVIVVGYGADTVSVLDGGQTYTRSLAQFSASWGVLGNMAITAE